MQWAALIGGGLLLAYANRDKLKSLLGNVLPAPAAPEDPTTKRVLLALELRAACSGACPKAVEALDAAFPHLLPGHVEETK